jgi:hypothetical protein
MLNCLYGDGATNRPAVHTVYGMSNRLYENVMLDLPEMQQLDQPLLQDGQTVATLVAARELDARHADQALCLPVAIRLDQPVSGDLHLVVTLRDLQGRVLLERDAVFATVNQRTSSNAAPGETLSAYPLLRPPYATPPGDYAILLRVYDEVSAPSGYDVAMPDGAILGKDMLLDTWTLEPGADWAATDSMADLPVYADIAVGDDLHLLALSIEIEPWPVQAGQSAYFELLWQGSGPLPDLRVQPAEGDWELVIPPEISVHDDISLDWRSFTVPPEAESGRAVLLLPDGRVLAELDIEALPVQTDVPEMDVTLDLPLGDLARIVGYSVDETSLDTSAEAAEITLLWQAEAAPSEAAYTVFVQLLNAEGRLIAQSDSQPAQGQRPTTGWRSGEYILDPHHLRYNALAAPGEATLIVGFYDALTGARLPVNAAGEDHLVLGTVTLR